MAYVLHFHFSFSHSGREWHGTARAARALIRFFTTERCTTPAIQLTQQSGLAQIPGSHLFGHMPGAGRFRSSPRRNRNDSSGAGLSFRPERSAVPGSPRGAAFFKNKNTQSPFRFYKFFKQETLNTHHETNGNGYGREQPNTGVFRKISGHQKRRDEPALYALHREKCGHIAAGGAEKPARRAVE